MKKSVKKPLVTAVSTAVASLAVPAIHAETNPFAMNELSEGYMQVAQSDNAAEMKCGANMKKKVEGSCGEGKCGEAKCGEGKCAGNLAKTGGESSALNVPENYTVKKYQPKTKEAACGEGKCGAMMENGKMKKGMENSCGAMMKGKEGSCGMGGDSSGGMGGMDMSGMKMKNGEMSCGAMMEKMKSGEMSCGAMMEKMKSGEMS